LKTFMIKIGKFIRHPYALLFIYLFMIGVIVYAVDYWPKTNIENFLMRAVPWILFLNMFLIFVALILCKDDIVDFIKPFFVTTLKKINYQGILLVLIIIFAFVMVTFVAPRTHRIFFDEDIYANIGQNMAIDGRAGMCNYGEFIHGEYKPNWLSYNKEPSGWPFLISLAFQIFGVDELYVFIWNNLLFTASVLLIFLITFAITEAYFTSILSAIIYCLIPHNLIWGNTAAAEPSAAFFTLFSMLCLIVYLKTSEARHLFALAVVVPFSCQMRPESILIIPLSFLAMALIRPGELLKKRLWGIGLITAIFLLPQILHLYAVSHQSWGTEGAKFSLDFFQNNIRVNGLFYLTNESFPALFTILAALGFVCTRYSWKWRLVIFVWFILFWGIFLFFYAGSYKYGADVRFSLLSFAPMAILAGIGVDWIKNRFTVKFPATTCITIIIVIAVFAAWLKFLPLIRLIGQEAWEARADHAFTREFIRKIPNRSIVVTHIPTMVLLWQQSAISIDVLLSDQGLVRHLINIYDGAVYFHHNYWCNTSADANRQVCQEIKQKYNLEEIVSDASMGRLYGLYRIRMRSDLKQGGN
jgi:4-amino-4-deoxy-L-arabinose transferase-like glycosyltransferase